MAGSNGNTVAVCCSLCVTGARHLQQAPVADAPLQSFLTCKKAEFADYATPSWDDAGSKANSDFGQASLLRQALHNGTCCLATLADEQSTPAAYGQHQGARISMTRCHAIAQRFTTVLAMSHKTLQDIRSCRQKLHKLALQVAELLWLLNQGPRPQKSEYRNRRHPINATTS